MLYLHVHIILCFIPLFLHSLDVNIGLSLSPPRVWLTKQTVFCCTYFFFLNEHQHLMQTCYSLHVQNAWKKKCATCAAGRKTWWLRPHLHVVVLLHNPLNCDVLRLQNHLKCLIRHASRGLNVKVVSRSVFVYAHVHPCTCASSVDSSTVIPCAPQSF